MAAVDFRIHMALSMCATVLKLGPELSPTARALIIGAMELLLDADGHIENKMHEFWRTNQDDKTMDERITLGLYADQMR